MRQPDSVSTNLTVSEQLKLRRPLAWPSTVPLRSVPLIGILFFSYFDSEILSSFIDRAVHQGTADVSFWILLSATSGLIWLLSDLATSTLPGFPKHYQKQRTPIWSSILKTILGGVSMFSFLVILLLYTTGKLNTSHGDPAIWALALAGGLMVLSGLGYLVFQYGNQILQPFSDLWQRVSITGYFDKEKYLMGEPISFQMRDRLTMNDKSLYRVHLQYANEYTQNTGTGDFATKKYVRQIRHRKFVDVSGKKLYDGIRLTTVDFQKFNTRGNQLGNRPKYWEILVEKHDEAFYARFFVNLK